MQVGHYLIILCENLHGARPLKWPGVPEQGRTDREAPTLDEDGRMRKNIEKE